MIWITTVSLLLSLAVNIWFVLKLNQQQQIIQVLGPSAQYWQQKAQETAEVAADLRDKQTKAYRLFERIQTEGLQPSDWAELNHRIQTLKQGS